MSLELLICIIAAVLLLLAWYLMNNSSKNKTGTASAVAEKALEIQSETEDRTEEEEDEEEDDTGQSERTGDSQTGLTADRDRTIVLEELEEEEHSGQTGQQQNDPAIVIFRVQPRANTWICENCETMNNDDFPYCFVCGTPKN